MRREFLVASYRSSMSVRVVTLHGKTHFSQKKREVGHPQVGLSDFLERCIFMEQCLCSASGFLGLEAIHAMELKR
jgi:hypothetical protein